VEIIFAYEPLWAIYNPDTNPNAKAATLDEIEEAVLFIKKTIEEMSGVANDCNISVLYGGSVKPENSDSFAGSGVVDGVLVGSASVDYVSFKKVIMSFM